ncbi:MAG: hypothetical protein KBT12_06475 [Bacteroidales bacterium]|nr:hypothetical protein [Candidatus Physcousia equi]
MTEERLKSLLAARGRKDKEQIFKVPEGYFDTLTERVMAKLAEHPKKPARRVSLVPRTWLYAAAVAVLVVVSSAALVPYLLNRNGQQTAGEPLMAHQGAEFIWEEEDGFEELDYAMVDNNEIAYYLTEY